MVSQGSVSWEMLAILLVLALFYGVFFVFPIGGADMPVVIALLTSLSGLIGTLPRTSTGKVQKFMLREQAKQA